MKFGRRVLIAGAAGATACAAATAYLLTSRNSKPSAGGAASQISLQSPWINDAEFIGYFVAIDEEIYQKSAIQLSYLSGGPDLIAQTVLLGGGSDIALTNVDLTVSAISKQQSPLKIIGAQYQKSPLGIVTLNENNIRSPQDLRNRRLAVPAANVGTTEAFLRINGMDPREVKFVPYQYDPTPLIDGTVDATVDFVTNVPYSIRLAGKTPSSFLFYDFGFKTFMDTVVVTEKTLASKRRELTGFLRASRMGWEANFKDPNKYPPIFSNTWFKGTNRQTDNEIYFNRQQQPLIESSSGIFSMTEESINDNIVSLNAIGLKATRDMFVTDLLREI